ncbi:MAG: SRPBCC family protein [Ilumatobacteraceae bacterium]
MELSSGRARTLARTVDVPRPVDEVWGRLIEIDRYPVMWPWLRGLDWRGGFVAGAGCACRVRSPLGYSVRFDVVLDRVVPAGLVEATVTGDVAGSARLELAPAGAERCELRLVTMLVPRRALLRALNRFAPPVARTGHDRIVRTGMDRFAASFGS